jgi:hypothetical protein
MSSKIRSIKQARAQKPKPGVIKVKLSTVVDSVGALQHLAQQPMAARFTYTLSKALRAVQEEVQAFEAARKSLNEKYGTLNAEMNKYDIREEDVAKWEAEYQGLLDTEVDLAIMPVRLEQIGNALMSAAAMFALEWLIVE